MINLCEYKDWSESSQTLNEVVIQYNILSVLIWVQTVSKFIKDDIAACKERVGSAVAQW